MGRGAKGYSERGTEGGAVAEGLARRLSSAYPFQSALLREERPTGVELYSTAYRFHG